MHHGASVIDITWALRMRFVLIASPAYTSLGCKDASLARQMPRWVSGKGQAGRQLRGYVTNSGCDGHMSLVPAEPMGTRHTRRLVGWVKGRIAHVQVGSGPEEILAWLGLWIGGLEQIGLLGQQRAVRAVGAIWSVGLMSRRGRGKR